MQSGMSGSAFDRLSDLCQGLDLPYHFRLDYRFCCRKSVI